MNIYNAHFSLKGGIHDLDFVRALEAYMAFLKAERRIESWRLMRRKLGLGPAALGDWHLMIEFIDLAQLDTAFLHVATRTGAVEAKHHCVNHMVNQVTFSLYRDFPDDVRQTGGELF
ncbi:MAG: DUF6614 family protein [Pseudomonadota bacterium]